MYYYTIRPDGTIRAVSPRQVSVKDPYTSVHLPTLFAPGKYRYDFETKKMVAIDPQVLSEQRRERAEALVQADAAAAQRRALLKTKVNQLDPSAKEAFLLLLEVLQVDL